MIGRFVDLNPFLLELHLALVAFARLFRGNVVVHRTNVVIRGFFRLWFLFALLSMDVSVDYGKRIQAPPGHKQ